MGCCVDIRSGVVFGELQGHRLLLHGLQCRFCSSTGSTSAPSFFSDLGVCRAAALMFFSIFQTSSGHHCGVISLA